MQVPVLHISFLAHSCQKHILQVYHWLSLKLFENVIVPEKEYYLKLIF